jgi:hypothetical protein
MARRALPFEAGRIFSMAALFVIRCARTAQSSRLALEKNDSAILPTNLFCWYHSPMHAFANEKTPNLKRLGVFRNTLTQTVTVAATGAKVAIYLRYVNCI